jgi:hypothetical protein
MQSHPTLKSFEQVIKEFTWQQLKEIADDQGQLYSLVKSVDIIGRFNLLNHIGIINFANSLVRDDMHSKRKPIDEFLILLREEDRNNLIKMISTIIKGHNSFNFVKNQLTKDQQLIFINEIKTETYQKMIQGVLFADKTKILKEMIDTTHADNQCALITRIGINFVKTTLTPANDAYVQQIMDRPLPLPTPTTPTHRIASF